MPTTEELMLVRIEANIKQLEREMRKAVGITDSAAKKMRSGFAKAFAGGFAGGFLGSIVHQLDDLALGAIKAADELSDMADSLHIDPSQLKTLQIVLRQLGGSEEDAAAGLKKFTQELGKAQSGEGDLLKILKSAHIPLKDSNGNFRDREAVLRDLIHAMSLMSSEEQRFLVATIAFGRNAAQSYANLGEAGVTAWDKIGQAAKDNGQVQEDAETRALAAAQDTIDNFFDWVKRGWADTIAIIVELIQQPALYWDIALRDIKTATTNFFNWFKSGWTSTNDWLIQKLNGLGLHIESTLKTPATGGDAGEPLAQLGDAAEKATPKVEKLEDVLKRRAAAKRKELELSKQENASAGERLDAIFKETAGYNELEGSLQKYIKAKQKAGELPTATSPDLVAKASDGTPAGVTPGVTAPDPGLEAEAKAAKDARDAEADLVQAIAERQQVYTDSKQSIEDRTAALELEARAYGMTAEAADELRAKTELLNAASDAGLEVTPQLSAEIDQLAAHYAAAAEKARDASDAYQAAADLAQSIGGAFEDAFVGAITQAESLEDALKNLLKTLAELFARYAFQQAFGQFFGGGGPLTNFFNSGSPAASPASSPFVAPTGAGAPTSSPQSQHVNVTVTPSPLLTVTWEKRAVAAEERAIARGPAVARNNSQRYAVP